MRARSHPQQFDCSIRLMPLDFVTFRCEEMSMKCSIPVLVLLASSLVSAQSPNNNPNKNEPPMLGPHLTREEAAKQAAQAPQAHKRGDLLYHGGIILPSVTTQAVFWGKTWGTYTGDKIS